MYLIYFFILKILFKFILDQSKNYVLKNIILPINHINNNNNNN